MSIGNVICLCECIACCNKGPHAQCAAMPRLVHKFPPPKVTGYAVSHAIVAKLVLPMAPERSKADACWMPPERAAQLESCKCGKCAWCAPRLLAVEKTVERKASIEDMRVADQRLFGYMSFVWLGRFRQWVAKAWI